MKKKRRLLHTYPINCLLTHYTVWPAALYAFIWSNYAVFRLCFFLGLWPLITKGIGGYFGQGSICIVIEIVIHVSEVPFTDYHRFLSLKSLY